MRRSDPRQQLFLFADSPQGGKEARGADESAPEAHLPQTEDASRRKERSPATPARHRGLLARVADLDNLERALRTVCAKKGAPGADGMTVADVEARKASLLPKLRRALLSKGYQPGPIRRVWIPKPDGGRRGLGIPTVVDRVVQTAILQILEPIYEPTFHPSSHGFRPGRSCHTALAEAVEHVKAGYRITVDLDLASFFDKVNHQRLLGRLSQRIDDRDLLRLIGRLLQAKVVLPDGVKIPVVEGVPQGGPLSPLLSNIVLDELDWELERRGHRFVRYADDCNVYLRSQRAGERVMAGLRLFLERKLRLRVNEAKSAVALSRTRHFLGFRVGATMAGRAVITLSKRSIDRINQRLRELTPRTYGRSLDACFRGLNAYMRGWMNYFHPCTKESQRLLRYMDGHVRRRIRAMIVRRFKRPRHLMRHLLSRGASKPSASKAAYRGRGPWWQSNRQALHRAYSNKWFEQHLLSLEELWRSHPSRTAGPG